MFQEFEQYLRLRPYHKHYQQLSTLKSNNHHQDFVIEFYQHKHPPYQSRSQKELDNHPNWGHQELLNQVFYLEFLLSLHEIFLLKPLRILLQNGCRGV